MPISCGFGDSPQGRKELEYWGPQISVSLGLDPTWGPDQPRAPKPDQAAISALIDTGAQESCIDVDLAQSLGLPMINKREVCGVGSMLADVYIAQVHVERLRYTITGQFAAVPLVKNGVRTSVVLGRSFLRDCLLVYNGKNGDVTIDKNL